MEHDGMLADTVVFLVERSHSAPARQGKSAPRSWVAITTCAAAQDTTSAP